MAWRRYKAADGGVLKPPMAALMAYGLWVKVFVSWMFWK